MEIGRKIYYEINTGNFIYSTSSATDGFGTTKEQDIIVYPDLIGKDPSTIDFIQLAFDERESEFQNMESCHVDPVTKKLTITPKI